VKPVHTVSFTGLLDEPPLLPLPPEQPVSARSSAVEPAAVAARDFFIELSFE
jgi:hypothetical protein